MMEQDIWGNDILSFFDGWCCYDIDGQTFISEFFCSRGQAEIVVSNYHSKYPGSDKSQLFFLCENYEAKRDGDFVEIVEKSLDSCIYQGKLSCLVSFLEIYTKNEKLHMRLRSESDFA